jgi:hypothetical protein
MKLSSGCVGALALAAVQCGPAVATPCGVSDLAWLQGLWHSADGKSVGEERWVTTPANSLAGSAWVVQGSAVSFVEANSISVQGTSVEMHLRHFDGTLGHAWEEKDVPLVFTLAKCEGQSAVFDGSGAKTGEHITYRRTGDSLIFVGDFLRRGAPLRVEVDFTKAKD